MKNVHENGAVRIVKTFDKATRSELYRELNKVQKDIVVCLLERRGVY